MCPNDPETDENQVSHFPDLKEHDPKKNGLMCFLNADRPCGADCMAFTTDKASGPEYLGQWSDCMLLQSAHRSAKHLVILAQVAGEASTRAKKAADDAARKPPVSMEPGLKRL